MELGLSLGDSPASKPLSVAGKNRVGNGEGLGLELGFCMRPVLRDDEGRRMARSRDVEEEEVHDDDDDDHDNEVEGEERHQRDGSGDIPVQLELLLFSPVPRHPDVSSHNPHFLAQLGLPWPSDHCKSDGSNRGGVFDVNSLPSPEDKDEGAAAVSSSSPNSAASAFQMDFHVCRREGGVGERAETERASSRASDEEENGLARKKLRLSKDQSAYLEESFKEHSTLNPKEKLALAKQLNLRPRQVEVWFQNRRARTKLKQTEVDCEYLKKCCEKLTEENRRLQKELQDLRALKTTHPFYMHLPATTLTMCPSCERVAATTANNNTGAALVTTSNSNKSNPSGEQATPTGKLPIPGFPTGPRFLPFGRQQVEIIAHPRHQPSAAT